MERARNNTRERQNGNGTNGFEPGTEVDHYRIIRRLRRSAASETYLAEDTALNRKVALKVLPPRGLLDERIRQRFFAEAEIIAKFNHPHIVSVYSFGEHAGSPYMALEFVEGRTLRDWMEHGEMSVAEAIATGLAIADALAKMHGGGVLHRDLNPENIVITHDGALRLKDFGLAAVFPLQRAMSTDVWALGSILCEMLGGKPPHLSETKKIPGELRALVELCLHKEPGMRPSADEAMRSLRKILRKEMDRREEREGEKFWHSNCYRTFAAL